MTDREDTTRHALRRLVLSVILVLGAASAWADQAVPDNDSVLQERRRLLQAVEQKGPAAIPTLAQALAAENPLVCRTAAHLLAGLGEPATPALADALTHRDYRVRLVAIKALAAADQLTDYWPVILMDDHPAIQREVNLSLLTNHPMPDGDVLDQTLGKLMERFRQGDTADRRYVIDLFSKVDSLPQPARTLLIEATPNEDAGVREVAYAAILKHIDRDWRHAQALLEAADADESPRIQELGRQLRWKLMEVEHKEFPRGGWRFKTDEADVGQNEQWYRTDFDDSEWSTKVRIKSSWQNYLKGIYHGVAWYRDSFRGPKAGEWDQALLHFEGVDEEAWVWLNGHFVGEHTEGPEGWNKPFILDVTDAFKPGEMNQLTVRARNTAGGGGIHAPLWLRLLDSTALDATDE